MDTEERVPRIAEIRIHVRPDYYLGRAHRDLAEGNNIGAIENYLNYMWSLSNPQEMKLIEQVNLTKLIINLGNNIVESTKDVENEVMKCYLSMLNGFPENAVLLNAFGVYFFSQGEYTVSRSYFQRAAAAGYLPGEKNFLHVIWHLIPRWHFRMLNDRQRNESYRDAIHKAINSGYKDVYDIGTGCGLLSLIAASYSEEVKVTAFEESKILSAISTNIFKRNNLSKNIKLIPENSNMNTVAPSPCNLLVTEIFDAGVFGENCLKSIKHALDHFVNVDNFKIIPRSVKIHITGFESQEITKKFRYTENLENLGLKNLCLVEVDAEPYDSEYLKKKNIKYLTETKSFLNVNFYDRDQLNELLTPNNDIIDEIELICTESGILHALAVWFDLNLDEEISISTHPSNDKNQCWEQAVFHLDHPVEISKDEIIKLKPRIVNGQLNFQILSHQSQCEDCIEVSREIITFLNDKNLVQSIIQVADNYENNSLKIVDFNIFPLFGFLMAKKGATVYHVYKDECDLILFNHIMNINELSSYKFIFIHQKAIEDYMVFLEPPNLVYTDFIKTDGSWNRTEFALETEQKLKCETLPKKIFLNAQLISSEYLDTCNKVDDTNALNFEIFAEINEYSGNEHPNLDSLDHEKHSSVVSFDISNLDQFDFHQEGDITTDGTCNGILYWFDIQFTDDESNRFSTLNSSHYDKCCTLLNKSKNVKKEEKITFHIMRLEGHLKVYCD